MSLWPIQNPERRILTVANDTSGPVVIRDKESKLIATLEPGDPAWRSDQIVGIDNPDLILVQCDAGSNRQILYNVRITESGI